MTLETGGSISGGLYRENAGLELPERHRVDLADFRHEQTSEKKLRLKQSRDFDMIKFSLLVVFS